MNLFTKIDLIDPVELWDCNCQTILHDDFSGTDKGVMESLFYIEIVRSNTKNVVVEVT